MDKRKGSLWLDRFRCERSNNRLAQGQKDRKVKELRVNSTIKNSKGGMCLSPDTLIQLYDGRIKRIKELTEADNPIVSLIFQLGKRLEVIIMTFSPLM